MDEATSNDRSHRTIWVSTSTASCCQAAAAADATSAVLAVLHSEPSPSLAAELAVGRVGDQGPEGTSSGWGVPGRGAGSSGGSRGPSVAGGPSTMGVLLRLLG